MSEAVHPYLSAHPNAIKDVNQAHELAKASEPYRTEASVRRAVVSMMLEASQEGTPALRKVEEFAQAAKGRAVRGREENPNGEGQYGNDDIRIMGQVNGLSIDDAAEAYSFMTPHGYDHAIIQDGLGAALGIDEPEYASSKGFQAYENVGSYAAMHIAAAEKLDAQADKAEIEWSDWLSRSSTQ